MSLPAQTIKAYAYPSQEYLPREQNVLQIFWVWSSENGIKLKSLGSGVLKFNALRPSK